MVKTGKRRGATVSATGREPRGKKGDFRRIGPDGGKKKGS